MQEQGNNSDQKILLFIKNSGYFSKKIDQILITSSKSKYHYFLFFYRFCQKLVSNFLY